MKENTANKKLAVAAEEIASLLRLARPPERIECFDISHTQGEAKVGSRVVFINGKPKKNLYRKFNVNRVDGVDDFASIREVLERRFRRCETSGKEESWAMPDLVIVDGGKGQLSAATDGMRAAGFYPSNCENSFSVEKKTVPIIALAKNQEKVFLPKSPDPLPTKLDSPALLLFRSIRDESHRFALKSHRRLRSANIRL